MKIPDILKNIELSPQQDAFMRCWCNEVLYGGAAGGGKSFIQLFEALWYAITYPGSYQIVFRRTFPELNRTLITESKKMYPGKPFAKYNESKHTWTFYNDSIIEFGYLSTNAETSLYQGCEIQIARFDEATHFTFYQVNYLKTRIRQKKSQGYPLALKLSTNPGGVGHMWAKNRFVDPAPPNTFFTVANGEKRIFIPSKVTDNPFVNDEYRISLANTADENLRKMLYDGSWDVFEGAFFSEFSREYHVREPFDVVADKNVKLYRSIDYGLDMLACYWYAVLPPSSVNPYGSVYVYRELCESNLTISEAAKKIIDNTPARENIICTYAPPDVLSHRDRVTGRNQGDMFSEAGLKNMVKSSNDRAAGWLAIKELLSLRETGRPILKIFNTCTTLIKHLPMLMHDDKKYGDVKTEPHLITHSPDSLRYFAIHFRDNHPIKEIEDKIKRVVYDPDMLQDYRRSDPSGRADIERIMGGKPKLR